VRVGGRNGNGKNRPGHRLHLVLGRLILPHLSETVSRFRRLRIREVLADAVDGEHREDADDRDDDHQLDQREPSFGRTNN
jgi:hypothetical protein